MADRVSWVQYPPERDARFSRYALSPKSHALPTDMRIAIGALSFFWLIILFAVIAVMLLAVAALIV
ncbi:MAG: hypothetical protein KGL35_17245 [Bradyrhizobium sp.]|nr:hypothetical protein [Bradyrhizobium sp.]